MTDLASAKVDLSINEDAFYGSNENLIDIKLIMSFSDPDQGANTASFGFNEVQAGITQSSLVTAANSFAGTPDVVSIAGATGWIKGYGLTTETGGLVVSQILTSAEQETGIVGVELVQEQMPFENQVVLDMTPMAEGFLVLTESTDDDPSQAVSWLSLIHI